DLPDVRLNGLRTRLRRGVRVSGHQGGLSHEQRAGGETSGQKRTLHKSTGQKHIFLDEKKAGRLPRAAGYLLIPRAFSNSLEKLAMACTIFGGCSLTVASMRSLSCGLC